MATAALTTAPACTATYADWSDSADVRAIAAAIMAADALSAKIACLPGGTTAAHTLGMLGTDIGFSSMSRRGVRVTRPSCSDSVIGELWGELENRRAHWIKDQLDAAGLGGVFDRPGASRELMVRAFDLEEDLERQAPRVEDIALLGGTC